MEQRISLAHGSGGKLARDLIEKTIVPRLGNPALANLADAADLDFNGRRLLFTTDSFVIKPLEFPGGDIGKLAVCGTVNDLAVSGARPLWISCGLIIEETFPMSRLERIIDSLSEAAAEAGVSVVCGDTKVVERGSADGLFINTAGIGAPIDGFSPSAIQPGDKVIISGTIGDHEAAVFRAREELGHKLTLDSDCAPLHDLVATMLSAAGSIRVMRDPTRGGVGAVLNELAAHTACSIRVEEAALPIKPEVLGMCELVGFDPIYLANEGKLVCIVSSADTDALLAAMQAHPLGKDAAIIGEVTADERERIYLRTAFGGSRIVSLPTGVQLPRIC
ncbi:MAG: hydrogenase expression/formation protein HypE [Planctomycetes bacterium]|nr:hydrogenase expression/formation protein HypE [Planctomycetota bacterium]